MYMSSANNVTVEQTLAAAGRSNIPGAKDAIPKEGEAITTGINVILAAECSFAGGITPQAAILRLSAPS